MRTRLASWFLVLLVTGTLANAQPLADRVPGDALIYVGWSGSESMGPGYAGSHLKAVLDESKFGDLINQSIPRLLKRIGATDRQVGEFTELLAAIGGPMWRHPTAFYFGGLDASNPNAPPMPKLALICDAGAEGKALADQVRKALANIPPDAGIKVEEQGGTVMVSVAANGWGVGRKPAAALPASKAFQSALAQVQKDPVASVYVDVEGIVKQVDQMLGGSPPGQTWAGIRDALGLPGIKRVIWTSGFDGRDWMSQAFVDAPAPRKGVLPAMLDAKPLSAEIMKAIPQTATLALAGKFDLGGLVTAIRSAAGKVDSQVGQMVDGFFEHVNQVAGMDVQADLLNQLGDEWAFYVDPTSSGNGIMGFSVVNRARDAGKVEASLGKLEALANGAMRRNIPPDGPTFAFRQTRTTLGVLHSFSVPLLNPTWAVRDGNLYLALYPQGVNGAMEHVAIRGRSILDNEDFKALRNRLGGGAPDSISFTDLPKTAPGSYGDFIAVGQMYLGFADLFGAESPALLFPPFKKVAPHLSPAGGVSWVDAGGWHAKSVSPFPGSEMLGSGGSMAAGMVGQNALLASILLPSLNRARETANRVKCGSNMRQIGQAILLYSNENRGKYPATLGELMLTQDVTWEVFVCPSSNLPPPPPGGAKPDEVAKWVNDNAGYVYLGAGMTTVKAGAETIVLYEKPDNHSRQGMNVLYGDGHVEFNQMPEVMRMIEAQKAGVKKGGRL